MPELRVTQKQREQVKERAKGCCEYCHSSSQFAPDAFSVEHIIPRAKGGKTRLDNLALACQGCNNHKYIKTEALDLVSGERVRLFNPRKQRWGDHFAWSDDFLYVEGLTAVGRATIAALHMNRAGLVNLCRVLCLVDEHPPKI